MAVMVGNSILHGVGCFASVDFFEGEVIISNKLLIFNPHETQLLLNTRMKNYLFYVEDDHPPNNSFYSAISMGAISFCNHSITPNCKFILEIKASEIKLVSERSIASGEELTIDYGDYAKDII